MNVDSSMRLLVTPFFMYLCHPLPTFNFMSSLFLVPHFLQPYLVFLVFFFNWLILFLILYLIPVLADTGAGNGNKSSLGAAVPSRPEQPTVREAPATAIEPAGSISHQSNGTAPATQPLINISEDNSINEGNGSNKSSLGTALPSLPQRPTVSKASETATEPAARATERSNGVATATTEGNVNGDSIDGYDETWEKLQNIRVKFLRLAHRLGQSPQSVVVAQVLYRLGVVEQIRGRPATRTGVSRFDHASALAQEQEATGQDKELDFACTILLLGKTGVGKSSTINSMFDERKTSTSAFSASTKKVQEIVGTVHGIKVFVWMLRIILQSI